MMNLSFCFPVNVFISSFFQKVYLLCIQFLGLSLCPFGTLKPSFHCHLASIFVVEKLDMFIFLDAFYLFSFLPSFFPFPPSSLPFLLFFLPSFLFSTPPDSFQVFALSFHSLFCDFIIIRVYVEFIFFHTCNPLNL